MVANELSRCKAGRERRRATRDRGFSLVEVIVTITLMGVVILPIMSAVISSVRASSRGRSAAQVETALVNAADRVNRAEMACHYEIFVAAAVQSQGWQADRASVRYAIYDPGDNPSLSGSWVVDDLDACVVDGVTQDLVQRVTITVTSPDGNIRREIQVVKSDV